MSKQEKEDTQTEIGSAPERPSWRRRWLRRALWTISLLSALIVATAIVFRIFYHGNELGDRIGAFLNQSMRGAVHIESIDWNLSDVPSALAGGWIPVTVTGLEVYDEFDDLVLKTDRATAELNIHAAITGRNDIVLRKIDVPDGGYAKVKQVREPYPESEFDHNVVSLISAFYPDLPPGFRAGLQARPGRIFDLRDYRVKNVTMEFDFPDFHAIAYGLHGEGSLFSDAADPLAKKLYYSLEPNAPIGVFTVGESYEVLTDIKISRLALVPNHFPEDAFPRDLEYELSAKGTGGAEIKIVGAMLDHRVDFYGGEHDITVTATNAGLASRLIAHNLAPESTSDIQADSLEIRVTGPVAAPQVALTVQDASFVGHVSNGPPLELSLAKAVASFDLATESGSLDDTVVRGLGGQLELAATFGLKPLLFDASLNISEPLRLGDYLPPQVKSVVGSSLSGSLRAVGNAAGQNLERVDLRLGRARVTGKAYRLSTGLLGAEKQHGLRIDIDRTTVRKIYGQINPTSKQVDLHAQVASSELNRLLGRLGYPAVARSVNGFVHVGGTLDDPHARGELDFGGVPVVSKVATEFSFGKQTLSLTSARAAGYGGSLVASGKIDLAGTPRLRGFTLSGRELALARVPGLEGVVDGRGSLEASLSGPLSAPQGELKATLSNWTVVGDRFADTIVDVAMSAGGAIGVKTSIARADGGRLEIDAGLGAAGNLKGDVELFELPVSGILALAGMRTDVAGGVVSSKLALSGKPGAPTVDGVVAATQAWLVSGFLGAVDLSVERIDSGVVQVRGKLLQGRVQIDGSIATTAPFASDIELRFHRLEADQFFPAIAEEFATRGWVSGALSYRGDLVATKRRPAISLRLSEVEISLENEDARGRPSPVRVVSRAPIEVSYDGVNAKLATPAIFSLPGGDLTVDGSLTNGAVTLGVKGTVALQLLSRYVADKFEEIGGEVDVDFKIAGTLSEPMVEGSLLLRDVSVKPTGQDASVRIASGRINVNDDSITTTGIEISVLDEFSDEAASLNVRATLSIDGLAPGEWAVWADGDLGGKMLLVAAPNVFSAASGRAEIDVKLTGTGFEPELVGEIFFTETESLTFTPRGLRREIRMTGGSIEFDGETVSLTDLSGWIDDEGQIVRVDGDITLESFRPKSLELDLVARDVPLRIPGVLLLSVNINDGSVIGNFGEDTGIEDRLEIRGSIEVADGRYIERWSPVINNLRPQRITESEPPIWERVPLLGNARLSLRVATPAFFVRNNIADITMTGNLAIEGTPLDPEIEGVIRVDQGRFKIPGVRAPFSRTSGTVSFSKFRDFPTSTPEVDITSESDYRDLLGQSHLVQMRLTGPIENISWDLSTAGGLNRAQTLTLVVFGRPPADARRLFGDEPVGRRPGEYTSSLSTVDSEGTAAAIDRVAKDLVGDQLDRILGDPIKNLTKLDVVRFEVGTASLGMHLEKEVTDSFRLRGDAERTLRGWSAALAAENRLNDTFSIEANGLEKRFDDETLEDERDLKLRLTWRKVLLP